MELFDDVVESPLVFQRVGEVSFSPARCAPQAAWLLCFVLNTNPSVAAWTQLR